ncbi:GlcG/HbpS family heme-binding protein [Acidicapsa acidisoli]|uniref:GlcG/HbpS family heme-binding protein n=1 Tax=Acidicapsa acidisoli TaxID=1615681 RepID=UPI0021E016DD|nr:heme-binding protein [Acidicapsa acidisoli]
MTLSMRKIAYFGLIFLQAGGLSSAWAADPTITQKVISQAGAHQVVVAAEQEAERLHAPCAIAVVDSNGILVAFVKMDDVRAGSPDLAIGKARTSALLQRPSAETESAINGGRQAFITADLMALRGGMPLKVGEQVVGAIGIASLSKENDVTISQAAAAAFAALSNAGPAAH